jgi:hypothetical protein
VLTVHVCNFDTVLHHGLLCEFTPCAAIRAERGASIDGPENSQHLRERFSVALGWFELLMLSSSPALPATVDVLYSTLSCWGFVLVFNTALVFSTRCAVLPQHVIESRPAGQWQHRGR